MSHVVSSENNNTHKNNNIIKFQKTPEYLILAKEQLGKDWKWRLINMHKELFPLTFKSHHQFKKFILEFKSLLKKLWRQDRTNIQDPWYSLWAGVENSLKTHQHPFTAQY